jgi:hypothetical protein
MSRTIVAWGMPLCIGFTLLSTASLAGNPNAVRVQDYASTPAARYAGMESAACVEQLNQRKLPYSQRSELAGVDTPVRITGPLHGVRFTQLNHTRDEAMNSDSAVVDCRLALALDDFASKLAARQVVEVGFISAYRPDPSHSVAPGQRHPAGLAMDVAWIRKDGGSELNVLRDFHGRVGARTCGARAEPPRVRTDSALELRSILCDASGDHLFNLVLTPNYNREHHNHVHLEVRRSIDWFLVQ